MKKIVSLLLASMMTLSLAACGASSTTETSSNTDASSEAQTNQSTDKAKTDEETSETTEAVADSNTSTGEPRKVGVSLLTLEHVFYNNIKVAMEEEAKIKNIELIVQDARMDSGTQLSQIQNFVTQKVAAIIMCPTNSGGSKSMVELAESKNIPIFTMDIQSDGEVMSHVATDNYKGGELAAQYAAEKVLADKPDAKVAVITYAEIESCVDREKGFTEWIATNAPNISVVDVQNYSGDQAKAADVMRNMLTKNSQLDLVFCVGDPAAIGALSSITAANRETKIIGFDGNPEGIAEIKKNGLWVADVAQDAAAIGKTMIDIVDAQLNGETVEAIVPIAPYIIDASNAE